MNMPVPDRLKRSISLDPEVFQQVHQVLKQLESISGTVLESTSSSNVDEIFEPILNSGQAYTLESFSPTSNDGLQLDVFTEDSDLSLDRFQLEAIVEVMGRPPLLIHGNDWDVPDIPVLKNRLDQSRNMLQGVIPAIGRIDGASSQIAGTGWLLDENLLVTNAHVARLLLDEDHLRNFEFVFDENAYFDPREGPDIVKPYVANLTKVKSYSPDGLDIAVFELDWQHGSRPIPLELETEKIAPELDIASIGYPANDGRDNSFAKLRYFQRVFEAKRLSPGKIIGLNDPTWFEHDCTTLGGSSGSPIISLETGKVVGLHFSGATDKANRAIKAEHLRKALEK